MSLGKEAYLLDKNLSKLAVTDLQTLENNYGQDYRYTTLVNNLSFSKGLYSFKVSKIQPASSAKIVMPISGSIQSGDTYLQFIEGVDWLEFVTDNLNEIRSVNSTNGNCPDAGDSAYEYGLVEGANCLQLSIEDGGPNDSDGFVNGSISHLGGLESLTAFNNWVTVTNNPINNNPNQGQTPDVILAFSINSPTNDAQVMELTASLSGDTQAVDPNLIQLYQDSNKNGLAEVGEEILHETTIDNNNNITFELETPVQLEAGDNEFLVTH